MPAVIGGVVALTATEGLSTQWVLLVGGSVGAAVSVGGYYYQKFYLGIDSVRLVTDWFTGIVSSMSMDSQQKANSLEVLGFMKANAHLGVPGWFFFEGTLWTAAGYLALRRLCLRYARKISLPRKGMSQFRLNDHLVFAFITGAALTFFAKDHVPYAVFYAGVNGLIGMTVLYFYQGIGIFQHYIETRRMPGFMLPVILIAGLFLGMPIIVFSFASVGLGDIWFDFLRPVPAAPDDGKDD
jgi:hypothetical protein